MAGRFFEYSNFKDNTTLNAIYAQTDDGYIAKYNSSGELVWVNTFGGANADYAYDIKMDGDGNILVAGTIQRTATFSDGEELGDPNAAVQNNYGIALKLNGNTGDIIWKTNTNQQVYSKNRLSLTDDGRIIMIINLWIKRNKFSFHNIMT